MIIIWGISTCTAIIIISILGMVEQFRIRKGGRYPKL